MPLNPEQRKTYDAKRYEQKKGQSDKQKKVYYPMRLSENILAAAGKIAAEGILTGRYPWKTQAEVIRAWIGMGMKRMQDEGDEAVHEGNPYFVIENQLAELSRSRRTIISMLEHAKVEIKNMIEMGNPNSAAQFYASTLEEVDRLSRTPWTDYLHKELKAAFPDLDRLYVNDEVPTSRPFERRSGTRGSAKKKTAKRSK